MAKRPPRLPQNPVELPPHDEPSHDEFGLPRRPALLAGDAKLKAWADERERHIRRLLDVLARQDLILPPGAKTAREIFEEVYPPADPGRPTDREVNVMLLKAYFSGGRRLAAAVRATLATLQANGIKRHTAGALTTRLTRLLKQPADKPERKRKTSTKPR